MARIRTLKPEWSQSTQVMNVSRDARLLLVGLITQADDEGRGSADPRKLKAAVFPGDDDIGRPEIERLVGELEDQRLAVFYDTPAHGCLYALPTWRKHQRVSKPTASRYPPPEDSGSAPGMLRDSSPTAAESVPEQSETPTDSLHQPSAVTPHGSEGRGSEGKGSDQGKEGKGSDQGSREISVNRGNTWNPLTPAARRSGDFEAINSTVEKLINQAGFSTTDVAAIARVAKISEAQARTSVTQLQERGRLS